jgi:hypothetical protein
MEGRPKMQIFLPYTSYISAMDFNQAEADQIGQLLNHIFFGLAAEDLIETSFWQYGPNEAMLKLFPGAHDGGIICSPSALGAELYLWAFGCADKEPEYIFDKAFNPKVEGIPMGVSDGAATKSDAAT